MLNSVVCCGHWWAEFELWDYGMAQSVDIQEGLPGLWAWNEHIYTLLA